MRTNLNNLAKQLVTSVNGAYNPLGTERDFFDAGGLTAGTMALDSTLNAFTLWPATDGTDGVPSGDNSIAQAVANLASKTFTTPADSISGTFSQAYSKTVTDLGQALTTANSHVTSQTTIASLVRSQRDAVSGVSLDEEMADLIKFQRAFQASSRVVQVIDELLDAVVNRLGA
jgi:flagellar hook-associated protein 1 FlgK